ncbi:hypothetical protein ES707_15768 [subsurface metagenome]
MKKMWKQVKQDPAVATIWMVIMVVMVWAFTEWLRMVLHGE